MKAFLAPPREQKPKTHTQQPNHHWSFTTPIRWLHQLLTYPQSTVHAESWQKPQQLQWLDTWHRRCPEASSCPHKCAAHPHACCILLSHHHGFPGPSSDDSLCNDIQRTRVSIHKLCNPLAKWKARHGCHRLGRQFNTAHACSSFFSSTAFFSTSTTKTTITCIHEYEKPQKCVILYLLSCTFYSFTSEKRKTSTRTKWQVHSRSRVKHVGQHEALGGNGRSSSGGSWNRRELTVGLHHVGQGRLSSPCLRQSVGCILGYLEARSCMHKTDDNVMNSLCLENKLFSLTHCVYVCMCLFPQYS